MPTYETSNHLLRQRKAAIQLAVHLGIVLIETEGFCCYDYDAEEGEPHIVESKCRTISRGTFKEAIIGAAKLLQMQKIALARGGWILLLFEYTDDLVYVEIDPTQELDFDARWVGRRDRDGEGEMSFFIPLKNAATVPRLTEAEIRDHRRQVVETPSKDPRRRDRPARLNRRRPG